MGFYENIKANTAVPLINTYGAVTTLTRESESNWVKDYNPTSMTPFWTNSVTFQRSDTLPAILPTVYTGKAVLTNFGTEHKTRNGDESLVKKGDMQLILADTGFTPSLPEPQTGDVFNVGGIDYAYVNHETVAPGAVVVIYKVQVRK